MPPCLPCLPYRLYPHMPLSSRRGSGSACRSVYGGWVEWLRGERDDGVDSIANQIAPESHWPEMRVLILVVSDWSNYGLITNYYALWKKNDCVVSLTCVTRLTLSCVMHALSSCVTHSASSCVTYASSCVTHA